MSLFILTQIANQQHNPDEDVDLAFNDEEPLIGAHEGGNDRNRRRQRNLHDRPRGQQQLEVHEVPRRRRNHILQKCTRTLCIYIRMEHYFWSCFIVFQIGNKCCVCGSLCVTGVAVILVIFGLFLIVETRVPSYHTRSVLVMKGDYVLLNIDMDRIWNTFLMLSLSLSPSNVSEDAVVIIYRVLCDQLNSYIVNVSISNDPILIPVVVGSKSKVFFKNCSRPLFPAICPIDQYLYQVKADGACIKYNINIYPFVHKQTMLRTLSFDGEMNFNDFLNGEKGTVKALKNEAVSSSNTTFILHSDELRKKSSYYFFALEEVKADPTNPPQWYTVSRSGWHVTYNLALVNHLCILADSNNHTCHTVLASNKHCYVAHFQGGDMSSSSFHDDEKVYVIVNLNRTYLGQALFIFGCILVSFIAIAYVMVFVILGICIKKC